MTHPIAKARFRPISAPILAPVIMSAAITSVYAVIAPWIPVTVVPTSFATVAIETFMTELSRVIRNWPAARVSRTSFALLAWAGEAMSAVVTGAILPVPPVASSEAEAQPRSGRAPKAQKYHDLVRLFAVNHLGRTARERSCRRVVLSLHSASPVTTGGPVTAVQVPMIRGGPRMTLKRFAALFVLVFASRAAAGAAGGAAELELEAAEN